MVWQLSREDPNSRLELLTAEPRLNLVDYKNAWLKRSWVFTKLNPGGRLGIYEYGVGLQATHRVL